MKLITRQDLANSAAERWRDIYFHHGEWRSLMVDDSEKIYDAIIKLGQLPKPEDVDWAIGNESWTRLNCSCCNKEVHRVITVDVTHGEYATHICANCIKEMDHLIKK